MELGEVMMHSSLDREGWWEIFLPAYGMTVLFKEHEFNDTQEVSFADESQVTYLGASGIARLMRLVGDWARENAYDRIF